MKSERLLYLETGTKYNIMGVLPITKKIGNFPLGSSVREERVPFE